MSLSEAAVKLHEEGYLSDDEMAEGVVVFLPCEENSMMNSARIATITRHTRGRRVAE